MPGSKESRIWTNFQNIALDKARVSRVSFNGLGGWGIYRLKIISDARVPWPPITPFWNSCLSFRLCKSFVFCGAAQVLVWPMIMIFNWSGNNWVKIHSLIKMSNHCSMFVLGGKFCNFYVTLSILLSFLRTLRVFSSFALKKFLFTGNFWCFSHIFKFNVSYTYCL